MQENSTDILLTNDDGYQSPTLWAVADALADVAQLDVVAPYVEQSGVGHGFTFYETLRYEDLKSDVVSSVKWVRGTPADCVKLAICEFRRHHLPDLVISGINPGENAGVASLYSGTVAAAREAALWGIPALAVSLVHTDEQSLQTALDWLVHVVSSQLWKNIQPGSFWSVNFPDLRQQPFQGFKVCSMSTVMFVDEYQRSENPRGAKDYWLTGFKNKPDFPHGSDDWWLEQGYATLTPMQVDQTHLTELQRLQENVNLIQIPIQRDAHV